MTIKTQGGKVITKEGKVSCSCCGCCMYSADKLGVTYEAADLPDEIDFWYCDFFTNESPQIVGPVILTKSGEEYYGPEEWMHVFADDDEWYAEVAQATPGVGECLLSDNDPASTACFDDGNSFLVGATLKDRFAESYSADGDTVTRQSLCVWSGPKTGGGTWTLRYNSTTTKWNLNGTEKTSGNQSDPTGTYAAGTVS